MDSIFFVDSRAVAPLPVAIFSAVNRHSLPCSLSYYDDLLLRNPFAASCSLPRVRFRFFNDVVTRRRSAALLSAGGGTTNSMPPREGTYRVCDFMTKKEDLHVVKITTTVDEALETLVEKRITGFPVIDDDWKLVGVVSDYDLLALDSISGGRQAGTNLFPDVDNSWKTFNELQKLLGKTYGKVVGDLMTPAPLVVRETTNLEDAARLLLETKYRRLPVVDGDGKLAGIITRGDVVRAALQIKHASQKVS